MWLIEDTHKATSLSAPTKGREGNELWVRVCVRWGVFITRWGPQVLTSISDSSGLVGTIGYTPPPLHLKYDEP